MLARLAAVVGKGVFAGAVGTAAMTLSSTVEARLRGRGGSQTPAEALCQLLGVEALGEQEKRRLTTLVHWGYGVALGGLRGPLGLAGMSGAAALAVYLAAVWMGEQVMLRALDLAPPPTEWSGEQLAVDTGHHLVYAAATSAAYEFLDRERADG